MSIENAKDFIFNLKKNSDMSKSVYNSMITALIEKAGEYGYDFNKEEYISVMKELKNELNDEILDKVAGGSLQDDFIMPKDLLFNNHDISF